jgi:hypothetical protein
VGEQQVPQPGVTAASVRTHVSVLLRDQAVHLRGETKVLPMFLISFRARVPVTSGASEYLVSVRCKNLWTEGPVYSDVRRGQIVTEDVAQNRCRGTAHIRVSYERGGRTDGLPFNIDGPALTVGTSAIVVR